MTWVTDRWPGFWNTVNSASNNRTMIIQRAKLRKLRDLAFIFGLVPVVQAPAEAAFYIDASVSERPAELRQLAPGRSLVTRHGSRSGEHLSPAAKLANNRFNFAPSPACGEGSKKAVR